MPSQLRLRRAGSLGKWGSLAIAVFSIFLFWPSRGRRIECQLLALAKAMSHDDPSVTKDWLTGLEAAIRADFSPTTAVAIDGVVGGTLSQDQIVEGVTQLEANSTTFRLKFDDMSVELTDDQSRAVVAADTTVEIAAESRTYRQRRHVTFSLQRDGGRYRIKGVEASANIVNLPEPRP